MEQFHETPLDSNAIDKYPAKIEQRNDWSSGICC